MGGSEEFGRKGKRRKGNGRGGKWTGEMRRKGSREGK
jgi:hypothetical protein